ncbi:TPA: hypothetical protein ACT2HS_001475 [Pasteurella multocida]|uniref:hypothetical protein n=1 Tax=Pasteurella multocida TaxID=747 RepID=UPI00397D3468
MTRYRWYKLFTHYGLNFILGKMKSMPFSIKNKEGFKIDEHNDFRIYAQYLYIKSFDNDGDTLSIVEIVDFVLLKIENSLFLRVRNPNHGIKQLANLFFDFCHYQFALEQIEISFSDCESLIEHYKFKSKVTLVKINNLHLTNDIESEMTFKSKEGVDLSQFSFLENKFYRRTQITWTIEIDGNNYKLSALNSGLLNISEYLTFDVLDYIELNYLYKHA